MIELTTSIKSKHTSKGVQYQYFINDVKVRTSYRVYSHACAVIRDGVLSGILCCGNFNTCQRAYLDYKLGGCELKVVTFPMI